MSYTNDKTKYPLFQIVSIAPYWVLTKGVLTKLLSNSIVSLLVEHNHTWLYFVQQLQKKVLISYSEKFWYHTRKSSDIRKGMSKFIFKNGKHYTYHSPNCITCQQVENSCKEFRQEEPAGEKSKTHCLNWRNTAKIIWQINIFGMLERLITVTGLT